MKNRVLLWVGIATLLLIGSAIGGAIVAARRAEATRNSAGTVSLATSPVVSGQTVGVALWNNTLGGIRQDVEDSLDRSGRGGMLAAMRGIDGTVGSPAFSYTSDTGLGEYRIGSGDLGWAVGGVKKLELTSSLFTVVPNVSFSGFVSGTLGIGVATPHATSPLFVLGTGTSFGVQSRSGQDTRLLSNSYFDGSNDKYNATGFAGMLQLAGLNDANFALLTAPSGSAGTTVTFTQRLGVNESGTTFSTGVGADGSGFKHKRFGSLCTTAAVIGGTCNTTLTWTTAFADANYSVSCTGDGVSQGVPINGGFSGKVAASISFITVGGSSVNASQYTNVDCVAVHD